jgi:hypothetical protein
MKKFILLLLMFSFVGCVNPSMERGLESLNDSLEQLEIGIDALGIPQMIDDLDSMNVMVGQLIVDVEEYSAQMEEFNAKVLEIKDRLEAMLITVQGITEEVDGMIVTTGGLATTEQMQNLLSQVQEFQQGVDILVAIADYDYDGVQNALDKCPDTPLSEINNVNSDGCSPSQLED